MYDNLTNRELKTEKRWIVYNNLGEFCSEHDHKYTPFSDLMQVVEIEIEVEMTDKPE